MANLLDYLEQYADTSLETLPFNELDAALLGQIVYLPLAEAFEKSDSVTMREAALILKDHPANKPYEFLLRARLKTLQLAGGSKRFEDVILCYFRDDIDDLVEKQFRAVTYMISGAAVITFSGTDLTLAGWKEDFNMAFKSPVPSQREAVEYLEMVADETPLPLVLTGHSKGGNLAIYAGVFSGGTVRERIRRIYALDGPGLRQQDCARLNDLEFVPPIENYLPKRSIVGILFNQMEPFHVVQSHAPGLLQHDIYRWQIKGALFRRVKGLSSRSCFYDMALDDWLVSLPEDDSRLFVETLYDILSSARQETLGGIIRGGRKSARRMLAAQASLSPSVNQALKRILKKLFAGSRRSVLRYFRSKIGWRKDDEEVAQSARR